MTVFLTYCSSCAKRSAEPQASLICGLSAGVWSRPVQASLDVGGEVILISTSVQTDAALERAPITVATHVQGVHDLVQENDATVGALAAQVVLGALIRFLWFGGLWWGNVLLFGL